MKMNRRCICAPSVWAKLDESSTSGSTDRLISGIRATSLTAGPIYCEVEALLAANIAGKKLPI